ncbi:MAG: DUF3159 domain-containing protein [Terrimesophilobacter sp.]
MPNIDDASTAEQPGDQPRQLSDAETFRGQLTAAVRKAGIGHVAPGEMPTGRSLLGAVGGVRGIVEAILPGLGFLVVYAVTKEILPSVIAPVALALIFVAVRLATRTPVAQALAGVAGIALSAGLALFTGRAEANFAFGLIVNAVSVAVLVISLLVRWPLLGFFVGALTNEFTEWRANNAKRRVLTLVTWLWAGVFSLRLAVQAPLFFAGQTEMLATTKLLMGIPLYAATLWVTWLLVSSVFRRESVSRPDASEE